MVYRACPLPLSIFLTGCGAVNMASPVFPATFRALSPLPSPLSLDGRGAGGEGDGMMKQLARNLRKNSTDAENLLWYHLRSRRLLGFKFRRQAVMGPYIVDFVCHDARMIIEIDGSQHMENDRADRERTAWLESCGFRVLRFWNHEVLKQKENVLERIVEELSPSP